MALIPTTQVNVSPEDYKRRIAYAMMVQGADAAPVEAWTQGAARALQGALGGYGMYQADQKQKSDEADQTKAYLNFLQPQGGQASPPAAPQPAPAAMPPQPNPVASALARPPQMVSAEPAAMSGPRPEGPVQSSPTVVGDAEAEARGLYEPSKPGMKVAQALAPPVEKPAMAPAPDDDGSKARIAALLQSPNKAERQLGKSLAENFMAGSLTPKYDFKTAGDSLYRTNASKGTAEEIKQIGREVKPMTAEQRKAWNVPDGMSAGIDDNGKPVFSPPGTNINLNTQTDALKKVQATAIEDMQAANASAREATKRSGIWDSMEKASQGFTPGATADIKLSAGRYLKDLGITAGNGVPDAEVFKQMQQQIAIHAQPKGQGSVSNAERELFAKAIPNITMSPESLKRSIDISRGLDSFDRRVASIYRENSKKNGGVPNAVEINEEIDKLGSPLSVSDSSFLTSAVSGGGAARSGKTKSGVSWSVE